MLAPTKAPDSKLVTFCPCLDVPLLTQPHLPSCDRIAIVAQLYQLQLVNNAFFDYITIADPEVIYNPEKATELNAEIKCVEEWFRLQQTNLKKINVGHSRRFTLSKLKLAKPWRPEDSSGQQDVQ